MEFSIQKKLEEKVLKKDNLKMKLTDLNKLINSELNDCKIKNQKLK